MKANEFINEAAIGTNPKRPAREGSRPARGHKEEARYKEQGVAEAGMGMWGDKGHNAKSQATRDLERSRNEKKQAADRSRAEERDRAWWKSQSEQGKKDVEENVARLEAQLDELSPQTLRSYLKKSKGHSQKYDQLGNKADEKGDEELANKMWNKGDNRYAGAEQARAKLAGIDEQIARMEAELAEHGKASRELCKSSKPDADLGASMLSSCKSQGLRARDGDKSHKLGKTAKSRVKVGGHRIKGRKYGGPLPDWS